MYLVYTLKAYLYVLQGIEESHKLFYRTVQLTYYILHGEHHTECQVAVYHCSGRQHGYYDVLQFVYEYAARLLRLRQLQAFHLHLEQVCLYVFPFPTSALLAVL